MEGLARSEISFRRSGSSGLVWDDKLLSGELKQPKPSDEERDKTEQQKAEPKPYKSVDVEPTFDPPSPKVSGCCAIFAKPVKNNNTPHKQQHKTKPTTHKS